jgi:hypothetical protein
MRLCVLRFKHLAWCDVYRAAQLACGLAEGQESKAKRFWEGIVRRYCSQCVSQYTAWYIDSVLKVGRSIAALAIRGSHQCAHQPEIAPQRTKSSEVSLNLLLVCAFASTVSYHSQTR